MADYSGAYERRTAAEIERDQLKIELALYKEKERKANLESSNFIDSKVSGLKDYVDCVLCGNVVRDEYRTKHREKCK